jgi:metal-responsive CopG/Arc/MetJ family transcriptional regulator
MTKPVAPMQQVTVKLPDELVERLDREAARDVSTRSIIVRRILTRAFEGMSAERVSA